MVFDRNIRGLQVTLRIDGYKAPAGHDYGDVWCDCGYSFRFGDAVNYQNEHDELFMPEEVDALAGVLTDLLDGKITRPREVPMTEPDFVFMLYPAKDLRSDPKYIYVAPGHELQDIRVEWRIFFWDGGLTDNFLTITLLREDIAALRDFLSSCRG